MTKSSIVRGRRWLSGLVAGVTLAGSISMSAVPGWVADAVTIPDVQFLNCLDRNLDPVKPDGASVTAAEIATIIQLDCSSSGITDLTGAKYLTGATLINVSSNSIADLSPLKDVTNSAVYAQGQEWDLAVVVDKATTVSIKGRSGEPITHLTLSPDSDLPGLTIEGAKIHASAAGLVDLDFADPDQCSVVDECVYYFSGTLSVTAAEEFTSTPAPTMSGKAAIGETLTADVSDWSPVQYEFLYQWFRNDIEIAGASMSTYTVLTGDAGTSLRVVATGVLDKYTSSMTSQAVRVGATEFTATPAPTITGEAEIGGTLTAHVSDWSPKQDGWTYQWYRNNTKVAGAVASTYSVTLADAGSTLKVAVTGAKTGYAPATATSLPTVEVESAEFTTTPAPTISGRAVMGETLTTVVPGWSPTPDKWTYQWYSNDTKIAGAVWSKHTVTVGDAGSTLKVAVTGSKTGYRPASATSVATAKVAANPFTTISRPKITGTATVGNKLTVKVSGWSPTPDSWTYKWYRNGRLISGATQSSYLLVGSDYGKRITVTVTGIRAGNNAASQTSSSTRKVHVGKFHTAAPIIAGTVQVGLTLTATAPGWSPTADHWSYRWYRNGKSISHATKSSYKLGHSDAGKKITVRMTGSKTGYTTARRTSKATLKVVT